MDGVAADSSEEADILRTARSQILRAARSQILRAAIGGRLLASQAAPALARWRRINAVVEPTWHDNKVADSDRAEPATDESEYGERSGLPLAEAITWAQALPCAVTIHLYGDDENPTG